MLNVFSVDSMVHDKLIVIKSGVVDGKVVEEKEQNQLIDLFHKI